MYKNFLLSAAVILFFVRLSVADTPADEFTIANEAEVLYGKGVHEFFDGNYKEAITIFDRVEYLSSSDPRPYFFMAIARYRLDADSAEADKYFKKAAKLEWEGRAVREYDVSDALRRIQGKERLHVEQYRTQAKVAWQKAKTIRDNIKYGQQNTDDKRIIADVSKGFVAVTEFGASSPDPYNDGKEPPKKVKSDGILTSIIESANPTGGNAVETVDVTVKEIPVAEYGKDDDNPMTGTIQIEGAMIIEDDDIFAEFDDEPKPTADPEPADNTETPETPKDQTTPESENEDVADPIDSEPSDEPDPPVADPPEPISEPEPAK
jgi:hypothetical protein